VLATEAPRAKDQVGLVDEEGLDDQGEFLGMRWLPSPSRKTATSVSARSAPTPAQHAAP
jgi:hypothetical protein